MHDNEIPIYLTPTFHHDIAYLKPERTYTPACFEIIDEALSILESSPEYCFTIEQSWLLEQYWRAKPERRDLMRRFASEGRLSMAPGLYAVPDMNLLDGESLYMQALVGKEIARRTLGLTPRFCLIADSWGHHAQLPQILTQCGYEYYGFSRCMRRDVNTENYRWASPDGSEINAHWYSMGYAGAFFPNGRRQVNAEELAWVGLCAEQIQTLSGGLAEYCGDDARILPVGGDMMFPSKAAPSLVRDIAATPGMPSIRFATIEGAMSEIDFSEKPLVDGEFEATLKGTWATNITIKQRNQRYSRLIRSLEALAVVLDKAPSFTLPWKLILKQQFHDTICGTLCDDALLECDRDYEAVRMMLTEVQDRMTGDAPIDIPAVFNPLAFSRIADVLVDGERRRIKVPALGFAELSTAVRPNHPTPLSLPHRFLNKWYAAAIDEKGYISSLIECATGRDLVAQSATSLGANIPFGGLMMQVDNGDGWEMFETPASFVREHIGYTYNMPDPYDRDALDVGRKAGPHMPEITSVRATNHGDFITIHQTGTMRFWMTVVNFELSVTLRHDSPRIEYHVEFPVESKHMRVMAAFPVNLPDGIIRHQIPYALIDRGEGLGAAQQFIDDSVDTGAGLALINRGLPMNNVEDGIMMLTLFRSTAMEYKTQSELSYNLGEQMAFDYALCPHGPNADDFLWTQAEDFNTPLLLTTLPSAPKNFAVENAFLSTVRPVAEGGVFLRIFDHLGGGTDATITVPKTFSHYYLTDGLQNRAGTFRSIMDGKITVHLDPHRIQGVMLLPSIR